MVTSDMGSVRTNQISTKEDDSDLIGAWRWFYRKKGWDKVARFEGKGQITESYVLYKQKNVTERAVREQKLHKARPITPCCKHPMAKFLVYIGRARSFVLRHLEGEHFTVHDCQSVPKMLLDISQQLDGTGSLTHTVVDVEGMYPAMPKPVIRVAMRELLNLIKAKLPPGSGKDPKVRVPKRGKGVCTWAHTARGERVGQAQISFSMMIEALDVVLENTYVRMRDGRLLKQIHGIPMGDSLRPGIAVGTTAWMEMEWMKTIQPEIKARFRAGRFMDDILMVVRRSPEWRADDFMRDFASSTCYLPPLRLEEADDGCFLETRFALLPNGQFRHRLKNLNEERDTNPMMWRYHRYDSFSAEAMKTGVLVGCLRKVALMASDEENFRYSLTSKLKEFQALGYPVRFLRRVCARMQTRYTDQRWRDAI